MSLSGKTLFIIGARPDFFVPADSEPPAPLAAVSS
jgi:hypothetical protein